MKLEIEIDEKLLAEHISVLARGAFERGHAGDPIGVAAKAIAESVRRQVAATNWQDRVQEAIERIAKSTVDAIAEEAVTKAVRAAAKRVALANGAKKEVALL